MKIFIPLKPYTPPSNKGFTLIELIIGGAVSLIVLSVTLGLVVEQRRLFLGDQSKINSNQNLRTASEFIGTDIRQVGERVRRPKLPSDVNLIPVVQVINGTGDDLNDELILQRKLLGSELYVCETVNNSLPNFEGNNKLKVIKVGEVRENSTQPECRSSSSDKLSTSLEEFKRYRCELDEKDACNRGNDDSKNDISTQKITTESECDNECVYGFIFDPVANTSEFFLYIDENYDSSNKVNQLVVLPLGVNNKFQNTEYRFNSSDPSKNSLIYILEEKKYNICKGVLQVTVNRRPSYERQKEDRDGDGEEDCLPAELPQPIRLVEGIEDFQVSVNMRGSSSALESFNEDISTDSFKDIQSIEIELTSAAGIQVGNLDLKTKFFPRNANSTY